MASLYRRHRPRTFADVVGQEHVVRTLRNAIEQDRVHHAYLFVGSRGTGKTSMAKILAASLNCVDGPTTTPDGTCESCVSIANATSLDVIEMDAASNNSVDDIRDLRERVAYAPVAGQYKVYILDEAHMLSTAAWNAFLKTLEEPPPHTIFVLATTEIQKVLPTVADRCHRFDFGRPTIPQIAGVLRRVADQEAITAPDEALALMARSATGSFRDALGTLEQLVAYSGSEIALEDVLAVLGAADAELLYGTVDAVAAANARDALLAAARLADSGRDVGRFFADLEAHLRALMVVQTLGGKDVPAELSMTAEADRRLLDQAGRVGPAVVTHLLELLAAGLRAMKDGADARTQLELALVKAADPARDASTKAVLARLERLERGTTAPAAPVSVHAPERPATPAGQLLQKTASVMTGERPAAVATAAVPTEGEPAIAVAVAPANGDLDLEALRELWPAVLGQVRSDLASFLSEATPVGLEDSKLTVAFSESGAVFLRHADRPANRELVAEAVRAVTGRALRLAYRLRAEEDDDGLDLEPIGDPALSEHDLIDRFVQEFDAIELDDAEERHP
ncbi:MAG: DNA polymerase III subunit gamma/tau [Solirubrobacteraceae bacterium]